jgi:hypothetical protein
MTKIKAGQANKTSARNNRAIAKHTSIFMGNAAHKIRPGGYFGLKLIVLVLFRGSLNTPLYKRAANSAP